MDSLDLSFDPHGSLLEENSAHDAAKCSKLRRSCESCRKYKARCNPSEADPERCQRCMRDNKQCVFLAAKARPKRAISSKARVFEMEQKLDDLMALLQSRGQADPMDDVTQEKTPLTRPQTPGCTFPHEEMPTARALQSPTSQRPEVLNGNHPFGRFHVPGSSGENIKDVAKDVISKGIISYGQAEELLRFWQAKAVHFPFIVLPLHSTLDTLRRDRPVLLLAIFCFSAAQLQAKSTKTLEQELRESFSRRIIVNGETSLDLLQGLLSYIAWYHLYLDLQRQQIYQFTQMAISMAVDLCIHKPAPVATSLRINPLDLVAHSQCEFKVVRNDKESKRTVLGCYVLTSSVCQSLRKPTNLKYADYFGQCCSAFAQNPEADTDILLQYYVRLQHFQDEVNAAFDYDSANNLGELDSGRIEILLRSFNRQLSHFEESFPPEIWNNVQISTTFNCVRIYLYEIGFHASPPSISGQGLYSQSHVQSWYYSNARTESLLACLQACKTYLDHCLMLPPEALSDFSLPDFIRIIYGLLVLCSFTRLTDFPRIQEPTNFTYYLNAFHAKTADILKSGGGPDSFVYLDRLFQASGFWLSNLVVDPMSIGRCLDFHPNFLTAEILPGTVVRTIWLPETTGKTDEISSDQMRQQQEQEQWEELDLLNNWPTSGVDLDEVALLGNLGPSL